MSILVLVPISANTEGASFYTQTITVSVTWCVARLACPLPSSLANTLAHLLAGVGSLLTSYPDFQPAGWIQPRADPPYAPSPESPTRSWGGLVPSGMHGSWDIIKLQSDSGWPQACPGPSDGCGSGWFPAKWQHSGDRMPGTWATLPPHSQGFLPWQRSDPTLLTNTSHPGPSHN